MHSIPRGNEPLLVLSSSDLEERIRGQGTDKFLDVRSNLISSVNLSGSALHAGSALRSGSGLRLVTLNKIDLSNNLANSAAILRQVFESCPALTELNLAQNGIERIPADLSHKHLSKLDLSENLLRSVNFPGSRFPRLSRVLLDRNPDLAMVRVGDQVESICAENCSIEALGKLPRNVRILRLQGNRLSELPVMGHSTSLEFCSLSQNAFRGPLTVLEIHLPKRLRVLDLSQNGITLMRLMRSPGGDADVNVRNSLETLDLRGNPVLDRESVQEFTYHFSSALKVLLGSADNVSAQMEPSVTAQQVRFSGQMSSAASGPETESESRQRPETVRATGRSLQFSEINQTSESRRTNPISQPHPISQTNPFYIPRSKTDEPSRTFEPNETARRAVSTGSQKFETRETSPGRSVFREALTDNLVARSIVKESSSVADFGKVQNDWSSDIPNDQSGNISVRGATGSMVSQATGADGSRLASRRASLAILKPSVSRNLFDSIDDSASTAVKGRQVSHVPSSMVTAGASGAQDRIHIDSENFASSEPRTVRAYPEQVSLVSHPSRVHSPPQTSAHQAVLPPDVEQVISSAFDKYSVPGPVHCMKRSSLKEYVQDVLVSLGRSWDSASSTFDKLVERFVPLLSRGKSLGSQLVHKHDSMWVARNVIISLQNGKTIGKEADEMQNEQSHVQLESENVEGTESDKAEKERTLEVLQKLIDYSLRVTEHVTRVSASTIDLILSEEGRLLMEFILTSCHVTRNQVARIVKLTNPTERTKNFKLVVRRDLLMHCPPELVFFKCGSLDALDKAKNGFNTDERPRFLRNPKFLGSDHASLVGTRLLICALATGRSSSEFKDLNRAYKSGCDTVILESGTIAVSLAASYRVLPVYFVEFSDEIGASNLK